MGDGDNGRTSLILSRNSFAHLKTGMASPTIALAAPTGSIGGRDGRADWESCWGHGVQTRSGSSCGGNRRLTFQSSQTLRADGYSVDNNDMLCRSSP
jgi:hypothetical protein